MGRGGEGRGLGGLFYQGWGGGGKEVQKSTHSLREGKDYGFCYPII